MAIISVHTIDSCYSHRRSDVYHRVCYSDQYLRYGINLLKTGVEMCVNLSHIYS